MYIMLSPSARCVTVVA